MIIFIPCRLALNSVPPRNAFRAASEFISRRHGILSEGDVTEIRAATQGYSNGRTNCPCHLW